jgi:nitronate monooxygenase
VSGSTSGACASAVRPVALRDRLPPVIATWLTERFGLTVPVVAAPMSGAASGSFAAAVCRAGGLGMIGISSESPDDVRAEAAAAAAAGTSYGVGLLAWLAKDRPDLLEVVIELRPPFVSLSYGDYAPLVAPLRAAGITVATQIGTVDEADQAVDAGVDVVVARGSEGGGHGRDAVATLPLLEAVLDRVDRPVLAAGGIATARGLAAVLAAGAVGAWVGTAFLGCPENAWSPARRSKVLAADLDSTIYTHVYDIAMRQPWPSQYGGRVVRNAFTATWHGREEELASTASVRGELVAAADREDFDQFSVWAGQAAGLVNDERSVADVVDEFAGAEALLRRWGRE